MKHFYQNEQLSEFTGEIWRDYPLTWERRPVLYYLERFRGERKNKIFTAHDHWELIAFIDGDGFVDLDDGVIAVGPGSLVLVPPGISHHERAEKRMDLIWLGFDAGFTGNFCPDDPLVVEDANLVDDLIEIWKLVINQIPYSGLEIEASVLLLLGKFLRLQKSSHDNAARQLQSAIEYINADPTREISVPELAKLCNVSMSHFFREFKKLTGRTPVNYQLNLRLNLARKYLLETDLPASQIARLCGFHDPFYFNKMFKRHFECPPINFRERHAGG